VTHDPAPATRPTILFDGVCNFCDAYVNFVIRNDRRDYFRFAPLQSEAGARIQTEYGLDPSQLDTFVVIERGKAYLRSTAALNIVRRLGGLYPMLYAAIVVPRPVRDFLYNWFAKRRYRWFGQKEECMIPAADVKGRFLTE
jgi:predicted DCC family thiol-disulfide oxidoreductase YuxK